MVPWAKPPPSGGRTHTPYTWAKPPPAAGPIPPYPWATQAHLRWPDPYLPPPRSPRCPKTRFHRFAEGCGVCVCLFVCLCLSTPTGPRIGVNNTPINSLQRSAKCKIYMIDLALRGSIPAHRQGGHCSVLCKTHCFLEHLYSIYNVFRDSLNEVI